MARPRTFDETQVLEQAMEVFWAQGYAATSVDDLVAATGLSRSSLYGAYQNKHGVFDAALDFYLDQRLTGMVGGLESSAGGLSEVVGFFEKIRDITVAYPERSALGCFMTNSITELAFSDAAVGGLGDQYVDRLIAAFTAAIRRSEDAGEIVPGEAAGRGQLLATLALGVFVRRRGNLDPTGPTEVTQAVRALVDSWRLRVEAPG